MHETLKSIKFNLKTLSKGALVKFQECFKPFIPQRYKKLKTCLDECFSGNKLWKNSLFKWESTDSFAFKDSILIVCGNVFEESPFKHCVLI